MLRKVEDLHVVNGTDLQAVTLQICFVETFTDTLVVVFSNASVLHQFYCSFADVGRSALSSVIHDSHLKV